MQVPGPPWLTHANELEVPRNSVSNNQSFPPPPLETCPFGLNWSVSSLDRTSPQKTWLRAYNIQVSSISSSRINFTCSFEAKTHAIQKKIERKQKFNKTLR